jgi:predicted aldo/keto reductase-like oxidoreductase
VLLPVNPTDNHHLPFVSAREEARRRGMGIIAMKVSARGRFFTDGGITRMDDLLTYALSQDVDVAIVGMENLTQLEDNVRIAKHFTPMPARLAAPAGSTAATLRRLRETSTNRAVRAGTTDNVELTPIFRQVPG